MLRRLSIRDYAIIRSVSVVLSPGLTVITGDSGAGKSILLEALGLCLGERAATASVRPGASRAEVIAEFELGDDDAVRAWLHERELDDADAPETLTLRRTVSADGRSRAYVNERPLPLTDLQALTVQLIDKHGQGAHQALLSRDAQSAVLDAAAAATDLAGRVAGAHRDWRAAERALTDARSAASGSSDAEWLRFQLAELDQHGTDIAGYDDIVRAHARLATAESAIATLSAASAALADNDDNLAGRLAAVAATLARIGDTHAGAAAAAALLDEARVQVQEAAREVARYLGSLDADPQTLAELDARLAHVHGLARRHRTTPEGLAGAIDELRQRLAHEQTREAAIPELEQKLKSARARFEELARKLSAARQRAAPELASAVESRMHALGMPAGAFRIAFIAEESSRGAETVDFQVSTNRGMPPGPLARVASGGELSRISLAVSVIAAERTRTPTLVLDEADVGVGGAVAETLGRTLRVLGKHTQVLCITHVAQVAAQGHAHLHIDKTDSGTNARVLDDAERINEVARMIGGSTLTEKTRARAEEMIAQGRDAEG